MKNTVWSRPEPNKEKLQDLKAALFDRPGGRPNSTDSLLRCFQPKIPSHGSKDSVLCKGRPGSHHSPPLEKDLTSNL